MMRYIHYIDKIMAGLFVIALISLIGVFGVEFGEDKLDESVVQETENQQLGATGWFDSNYSFCRNFTMNSSQIATTTTSGFALVATSTISDLKHTDHGGDIQLLQEDDANTPKKVPQDVVITDGTDCNSDGGAKLDFYFEEYASTTGEFTMHVEHTDVSSTTDKEMLMYYGNGSATDQSNEAGVYGGLDEHGVWNLHEDPETTPDSGILDSTANNKDGTATGTDRTGDLVDGIVNSTHDFDDTESDHIDLPGLLGNQDTTGMTWSAWIHLDSVGTAGHAIVGTAGGSSFSFYGSGGIWIEDNERPRMTIFDGAYQHAEGDVITAGRWYHIVGTYSPNASEIAIYEGGQREATVTTGSPRTGNGRDFIARNARFDDPKFFDGVIDDVRVYARALSDADVETIYNNTADSDTFWTIGAEETEVDETPSGAGGIINTYK